MADPTVRQHASKPGVVYAAAGGHRRMLRHAYGAPHGETRLPAPWMNAKCIRTICGHAIPNFIFPIQSQTSFVAGSPRSSHTRMSAGKNGREGGAVRGFGPSAAMPVSDSAIPIAISAIQIHRVMGAQSCEPDADRLGFMRVCSRPQGALCKPGAGIATFVMLRAGTNNGTNVPVAAVHA